MCDPVSALIAGTVISAAGSIMQGMQANQAAQAQAQALRQQAEAERRAAAFEIMQTNRQQEYARSSAMAQIGQSGVGLSGSPTEVLVGQAGRNQLDLQAIQYGSQIRQNNLRTQASNVRSQGKQAMLGGFVNAAGSVASGFQSLYNPANSVNMTSNPFGPTNIVPGGY